MPRSLYASTANTTIVDKTTTNCITTCSTCNTLLLRYVWTLTSNTGWHSLCGVLSSSLSSHWQLWWGIGGMECGHRKGSVSVPIHDQNEANTAVCPSTLHAHSFIPYLHNSYVLYNHNKHVHNHVIHHTFFVERFHCTYVNIGPGLHALVRVSMSVSFFAGKVSRNPVQ